MNGSKCCVVGVDDVVVVYVCLCGWYGGGCVLIDVDVVVVVIDVELVVV